MMERLLPHTGKSVRLGITGVPGVGKSTFVENLGLFLVNQGLRVAVLAVDPSSSRSGGSILGGQDPYGTACGPSCHLYPALSFGTNPGRGGGKDPGNPSGVRGRRF